MKAFFIFLTFSFFTTSIFGQQCICNKELNFVIKYYEANLPSFSDNVNQTNRKEYEKFKMNLLKQTVGITGKSECFKLLTYYVEYFKDNHSGVYMQNKKVYEKDPNSVSEFLNSEPFTSREIIKLKQSDNKQFKLNDIKGIYQSTDSLFKIVIVPNKNSLRDFVGVVIETKTPLWKVGQVKMELKNKSINKYEAFVYSRNHSLRYYPNYELKEGILGDNWFKTTLKRRISYNLNNLGNVEFRILNDSTTYIRVPAFDNELYSELDSFYRKNDKEIMSKPYLIIDVRNNGGGSDRNARPLLKYIYTKPFTEDTVDLYVTEENIKMWELWYGEQSKDTLNFDKDYQVELAAEIDKMKKTFLNSFLQRGDGNSKVTDTIVKYPEKVAIIINKYCASSCETLLFWAKESDKTILVGENSGGYVGYGEVGGLSTPCYNFNLTCTMTRYRNQRKYEVIGIAPDYLLDNSADWIAQTMKILYKK